jgi:hypothetical protein
MKHVAVPWLGCSIVSSLYQAVMLTRRLILRPLYPGNKAAGVFSCPPLRRADFNLLNLVIVIYKANLTSLKTAVLMSTLYNVHPMKACGGIGGVAPLILILGTHSMLMFRTTGWTSWDSEFKAVEIFSSLWLMNDVMGTCIFIMYSLWVRVYS